MLLKEERLDGVHPALIDVVKLAAELYAEETNQDVMVLEGGRTKEKQAALVKAKASKTMNSRHLMQQCGFFCAVDLAPVLDTDGDGDKEPSWHWPHYREFAKYVKDAAKTLEVNIQWGGDIWASFPDGPHWQLPWSEFP
jgi:peptidoglycan L-alanyl-D-glutamate endopeptidase CwlK